MNFIINILVWIFWIGFMSFSGYLFGKGEKLDSIFFLGFSIICCIIFFATEIKDSLKK